MSAKYLAQMRRVFVVKAVGNALDRKVGTLKEGFHRKDELVIDNFFGSAAGAFFQDNRKIVGRNIELVGIEFDAVLSGVVTG